MKIVNQSVASFLILLVDYSDYKINMMIAKILYPESAILNSEINAPYVEVQISNSGGPERFNFIRDINFITRILLDPFYEITLKDNRIYCIYFSVPVDTNNLWKYVCIMYILRYQEKLVERLLKKT